MICDSIIIAPPRPGVCKLCALPHPPGQPHNPNSLYYQIRFRQIHGRFPTWTDAAQHCGKGAQSGGREGSQLEGSRRLGSPESGRSNKGKGGRTEDHGH